MTTAGRLRKAVEAALVCSEHPSGHIEACEACSWFATASSAALAAALPIVEELERDAARYRHLRRNCQYGFDDSDAVQLVHRNGETGVHQNPRWREDLDAAIDAAMKGERDGE